MENPGDFKARTRDRYVEKGLRALVLDWHASGPMQ